MEVFLCLNRLTLYHDTTNTIHLVIISKRCCFFCTSISLLLYAYPNGIRNQWKCAIQYTYLLGIECLPFLYYHILIWQPNATIKSSIGEFFIIYFDWLFYLYDDSRQSRGRFHIAFLGLICDPLIPNHGGGANLQRRSKGEKRRSIKIDLLFLKVTSN